MDQEAEGGKKPAFSIQSSDGGIGSDGSSDLQPKQRLILEEVKKQLKLAGPLIMSCLLQYCLQLISIMFVGHLGELALAGASVATSLARVTGFSLMGLWLGIICAAVVQDFCLLIITLRTNWDKQAKNAAERVLCCRAK